MTRRRLFTRHAFIAVVDSAMFVAFLALMAPGASTGFVWHEWIGVAFIPFFVVHLVLSWTWITTTFGRLRTDADSRARINFLLNTSLFIMRVVVIVSGLVVSDYVFPALGLPPGSSGRWRQLHNFTSSLILPVVGLHVALNWTWIRNAYRRYFVLPWRGRPAEPEAET